YSYFLFLTLRHPPSSTLFPYTTLFRSHPALAQAPQPRNRLPRPTLLPSISVASFDFSFRCSPVVKFTHDPPQRRAARSHRTSGLPVDLQYTSDFPRGRAKRRIG